ncbi:hypothetical protein F4604DRAFT_1493695, partial [Suillus subluteus]
KVKEFRLHTTSVNSVSGAPHKRSAIRNCASSGGTLFVLTKIYPTDDGQQGAGIFNTTPLTVFLMPMTQPGSHTHPQQHDTQP